MATYLHYVGNLYTPSKFVEEAKRIGVSRRIPLRNVKRLEWGDVILCAKWEPEKVLVLEEGKAIERPAGFKRGKAHVFCSFKVEQLFIEDPEARKVVFQELRRQGKLEELSTTTTRVERVCGVYYVTGIAGTTAGLREIASIILGVNPEAKVMIGGSLEDVFEEPLCLSAPFTRTLYFLWSKSVKLTHGEIISIRDHRIARTKEQRKRLDFFGKDELI